VVADDRDARDEDWNAHISGKDTRGVERMRLLQSYWWSRKKGGIQLLGPLRMDPWGYMICFQLLDLVDREVNINGWLLRVLVRA